MTGEDVYRVGPGATASRVVYNGTQRLTVERDGRQVRYDAQARYTRNSGDGPSDINARFIQELLPDGSFEDQLDQDPDFLTILNQPFAIQLDAPTLHDLRSLRGKVPFAATSPFGGNTSLRGFLRKGVGGVINGRRVVAVRFEADGPMSGQLPHPVNAVVSGRMRLEGTAYYATDDAILLALNAQLTIVAQLHDAENQLPVKITYTREIRGVKAAPSTPPLPLASGALTPTPSPTPPSSRKGAGTREVKPRSGE
jgi:hypothetical protein